HRAPHAAGAALGGARVTIIAVAFDTGHAVLGGDRKSALGGSVSYTPGPKFVGVYKSWDKTRYISRINRRCCLGPTSFHDHLRSSSSGRNTHRLNEPLTPAQSYQRNHSSDQFYRPR